MIDARTKRARTDMSENAAYDAARSAQAFVEGRIANSKQDSAAQISTRPLSTRSRGVIAPRRLDDLSPRQGHVQMSASPSRPETEKVSVTSPMPARDRQYAGKWWKCRPRRVGEYKSGSALHCAA